MFMSTPGVAALNPVDKELGIRQALEINPSDLIDPFEYAEYRVAAPVWCLVEIGPGMHPNGLNRNFGGLSRYIGLENFSFGYYELGAKVAFERLRSQRAGENITLQRERSFGRNLDDPSEENLRYGLPGAIANEVYISRVYDKSSAPSCEHNHDEQVMTNEVARLLAPDGRAVIFDYDRNAQAIAEMLKMAGLRPRFASREAQFDIEAGEPDDTNAERHEDIIRKLGGHAGSLLIIASR